MGEIQTTTYRKDIDGIRAIAVLSVILFHFGYLPNGYLGVDIFFTISGYLITSIIYKEALEGHFSIFKFYLRRIRRIIPLVLFTTLSALLIGLFVMLPDDLENLCQSIFATNIFANNILLLITTGDYWAIVNEYKPLMHTWSLGIEEQFYLVYPIIFLFFNGRKSSFILPFLFGLTAISLLLFTLSANEASTFYSIQFRFFELSLGGIAAILTKDKYSIISKPIYAIPIFLTILAILLFDFHLFEKMKLFLIVIFSIGLLIIGNNKNNLSLWLLENKFMTGIGKISFSLYMWHQIVLAYSRYFIIENINKQEAFIIFLVILFLSIFSYFLIEQPFRNQDKIKTKTLLIIVGSLFFTISASSIYIYIIGGGIRDVPELNLYKSNRKINVGNAKRNIHIEYNAKIYDLDKNFTSNTKIKVLVVGNSFARDFANILLESNAGKDIEISYIYDINLHKDVKSRFEQAKFVFFSDLNMKELITYEYKFSLDTTKAWNVGVKNFGQNNGIFYNKKRDDKYCSQKTNINKKFIKRNNFLKKEWKTKYIDLIGAIINNEEEIPIFTPNCKFISQDCSHLTEEGAKYFAQILNIDKIFNSDKNSLKD